MILDAVLLLVCLYEAIKGWKKGVLYTLGSLVVLVVCFFLANFVTTPVTDSVTAAIREGESTQKVAQLIETNLQKTFQAQTNTYLQPYLKRLWRSNAEDARRMILDPGKEMSHLAQGMVEQISKDFLGMIIWGGLFAIIFFTSFLILRGILRLISKGVNQLPILGHLNRFTGLLVGLLTGVLVSTLLLSLTTLLSGAIPGVELSLKQSHLAPILTKTNLIELFLDTIL